MEKRREFNDTKRYSYILSIVLVVAIILIACFGGYSFSRLLGVGASEAIAAYGLAKDNTISDVRDSYYQDSYDKAEKKYHVKNVASINIDNIQKKTRLEVLKVSETDYVIANKDDNKEKITSWLEVSGYGVFTVDLSAGEFLVDNARKNVIVRVPEPKVTNFTLQDYNQLFVKNEGINESNKVGDEFIDQQIAEADSNIRKSINDNQTYYLSAKSATEDMLTSMIMDLNADIKDLQVTIEWITD